jgi:hypothetical protein
MDQIVGACEFSKIDLRSGRFQFRVAQRKHDGIAVDPSRWSTVLQWEAPKSITEIRSFLELATVVFVLKVWRQCNTKNFKNSHLVNFDVFIC